MRWGIIGLAFILAAAGLPGPVFGETTQQLNWCNGKDGATPDLQIGGCTALIQSGKYTGNNLAIVFRNRGFAFSEKHQYDRAIQDYDQAIRINPNYDSAFMDRGNVFFSEQQYDRAIRDYDEAIRLKPNYADAFINRGNTYANKEQYDRAIQDFDQVIRINPNSADGYSGRGNMYYNKHEFDRAIVDYTKAVAINPHDSLAYANRGDAYTQKKDYDRAIADYTTSIEKNASNVEAFGNRARAYKAKNDYEHAIADYTKAIELKGPDGLLYANRGNTYLSKRDFEPAAADFTKAFPLLSGEVKGRVVRLRWIANLELKQNGAAIADLVALATGYPNLVSPADSSRVYRTLSEADKNNHAAEAVEVIQALKRADYRGQDPRQLYDGLNNAMIDALVRLGRINDIAAVIPDLKRYSSLLKLRIDVRYASLQEKSTIAALLQPQDFAARQLAAAQKSAATFSKNLDAQSNLIRALLLNGRYAEAVNLGQGVLSNLPAYEKNIEEEASLRNAVADALVAEGQIDAAVQVLQPVVAMDVDQHGFVVNQLINLGEMMMLHGRFQEAIDLSRKARARASVYGEMWIKNTEICGLAWIGKPAEAEPILQDLLKTADSNYDAATRSLICLGHDNQAVAMVIARLKSETDRSSMLLELQDCRDNPNQPKLSREYRNALLKIRDRADVRKVLEKVGVIISEPIACGDR